VQIVRKNNKGTVKAKVFGPLWGVAALGCMLALILVALSIWQRDGMGLLATILLGLLSTLIGWGNKWTLNLPKRGIHTGQPGEKTATIFTPPGDVVIRYPKGNFLIVQCVEDVARELYFAPENIDYLIKPPWQYRMISLVGTLMLMFGVIFLGNSGTPLQIAYAVAYMLLNVAYWVVAALPSRLHWEMGCFEVHEQCFATPDGKCPDKTGKIYVDLNKSFTQALWKAIVATKDIDWIERSSAAPKTTAWNEWLHEAKTKAKEANSRTEMVDGKEIKIYDVPDWNPQKALADCLNRSQNPDQV
jgi:hypothetical protein